MKLESTATLLTTALLLMCGSIGIGIGISDVFGFEHHFTEKEPIGILLSMVGLISLSLGLERAIHQRKLDIHLVKVEHILSSQIGGRLLRGSPEIYSATSEPLSRANRSIRTIVYGKSAKAPPEFGRSVARRLHETKESGNPITFDVVFALDLKNVQKEFHDGVVSRLHLFKKLGVEDQVRLSVLDCNDRIGFDALLIDDENVFFSFPVNHGTMNVQTAIFFNGHVNLGRDVAAWFEERIKPNAQDYWKWAKTSGHDIR